MFAETHWFAIGIPIMVFFQKVGWSSRNGCCRIFSTSSINNSTVSSFSELMLFYFELVFVNFNSNDTTNIWCFLFMTLNITIVTTSGEIHDEWTLAENVPQPDYRTRMSRHWDEWISRKPSSYLFHHPSSILSYPIYTMGISHHPVSRESRST